MLATALLLIIIEYTGVLLAIIADLASGLRKARAKRIPRTSRALRRTIDKIARYFNALFALTILDGMIIAGIVYLRTTDVATFPIIPLFSMLGAIALTIIEIKSICEKTEEKGPEKESSPEKEKVKCASPQEIPAGIFFVRLWIIEQKELT